MTKPAGATKVSHHTCHPINLAIQGGGAHGAFAWGVIDKLLEDGRVSFEGISGTSAGSLNAVVLAYGLLEGGPEGAREKLHNLWLDISKYGVLYNPCKQTPMERFLSTPMDQSAAYLFFDSMTKLFSPYQLNPNDFNPLRELVLSHVDFKKLNQCQVTKLFLTATNVRTGQAKVFKTDEITIDTVMASSCLPYLFKSVVVDGEYYWDGGYTGNPSLFPFFYKTQSSDILIIHINPIERPAPPTLSHDIFNRINEISFNSALLKEFRAISFVHKLLDKNMIKEEFRKEFKYILLHSIKADNALSDLSLGTKFCESWDFLKTLFNRGRSQATEWLDKHYQDLGVRGTVDIKNALVGLNKPA